MLQQKFYTQIYTAFDEYAYLQLLLHNEQTKEALVFDGLKFIFKPLLPVVPSSYKQLKYPNQAKENRYEVESVRQLGDISFIKFRNGDVFQLYFMMDDNKSNQRLSIFNEKEHRDISTPLGISLYDAVIKTFNEAEECDIFLEN